MEMEREGDGLMEMEMNYEDDGDADRCKRGPSVQLFPNCKRAIIRFKIL